MRIARNADNPKQDEAQAYEEVAMQIDRGAGAASLTGSA